jgi:hypothetical protein
MTIAEQHHQFKIKMNKLNSLHYEDLLPYQIDSKLNEAALFICNHWGEIFQFGTSQFNKDLFGTSLVKYPDQPNLSLHQVIDNQYEYKLSNLKYPYLHLDRAYVKCGNSVVPISIIRHDEQHKLNDGYQKPSFKWKRLLGTIGKSSDSTNTSLYIYSDVDLTNKEVRLEYVKLPRKVFFGYYDSVEYLDCKKREQLEYRIEDCNQYYKKTDVPVNSDLPISYHDLQVDVATWLTTGNTENQFLNQFLSNKIQMLPK